MRSRLLAWLALNHLPGAGAVTIRRLVSRFGSPDAVLDAAANDLAAAGCLNSVQVRALVRYAADRGRFEELARELESRGVQLVAADDAPYPANLRGLRDAPPLLYVRGSLAAADDHAVAVVGTRDPTPAGAAAARELGAALASRGVTVVSGLALGIDAAAHAGALSAGRTIAVLGGGIERVSPSRHRVLAEQVAQSGALLSELPPDARASRETLLARNRIQAGLAKAVVVVQCKRAGGSFTTARRALTTGRQVLVMPWDEPEFAEGVRRLTAIGARMVTVAEAADRAADLARTPLPAPAQGQFDEVA